MLPTRSEGSPGSSRGATSDRAVGGNAAQIAQYLCRTLREIAPSLQKLAYCRTRKSVTSFRGKVGLG
jgi:hypothetical protein